MLELGASFKPDSQDAEHGSPGESGSARTVRQQAARDQALLSVCQLEVANVRSMKVQSSGPILQQHQRDSGYVLPGEARRTVLFGLALSRRYLASNKIEDMSNVCTLPSLKTLDLGYNHIRHIAGLSGLKNLRQLYLGRNKIEKIEVRLPE